MRVLAISGSPSAPSINHALLEHALTLLPEEASSELWSIRALDAPFFSGDHERTHGVPPSILDLHRRIQSADAVVLASPEYNGSMPAMLKNTIDWLSRVERGGKWMPRPLVLISTSPGKGGGAGNLKQLAGFAPWWGATLVGTYSLGAFSSAFDADAGQLRDAAQTQVLRELMVGTVAAAAKGARALD